jgi:hypothetical protein
MPHFAGTNHVVPVPGTAGHARVVARGCRVDRAAGYFAESDGDACGHGYTWDCSDCPALPDAQPAKQECVLFRLEVPHV